MEPLEIRPRMQKDSDSILVKRIMTDYVICYDTVAWNLTAAYDNCISLTLALRSRDQATSDVTCSSFMTSVMTEFVSGALRTSELIN